MRRSTFDKVRLLLVPKRPVADSQVFCVVATKACVAFGLGQRRAGFDLSQELLVPARDQRCAGCDAMRWAVACASASASASTCASGTTRFASRLANASSASTHGVQTESPTRQRARPTAPAPRVPHVPAQARACRSARRSGCCRVFDAAGRAVSELRQLSRWDRCDRRTRGWITPFAHHGRRAERRVASGEEPAGMG